MRRWIPRLVLLIAVLSIVLAGCRNETQNQIRRNIQDFTNTRMYITVYSYDGEPIFEGLVDGKVTRAAATGDGNAGEVSGSYIFWYDDRGRYHQTDLPYLVTTYERGNPPSAP